MIMIIVHTVIIIIIRTRAPCRLAIERVWQWGERFG